MAREWVLWDGSCGFCGRWAHWVERNDTRDRFEVTPYQNAPSPPMHGDLGDRCKRALYVVTQEGQEIAAGRAVLHILDVLNKPGPWRLLTYPPLIWFVEIGYKLVAANRGRLGMLAPRP